LLIIVVEYERVFTFEPFEVAKVGANEEREHSVIFHEINNKIKDRYVTNLRKMYYSFCLDNLMECVFNILFNYF
jgi:predicted membrane protein